MNEVLQLGPWASVLVAVFLAWGSLSAKIAKLETILSERKDETDRRFNLIEENMKLLHPSGELDLLIKRADEEHVRLWDAIGELRSKS